MEPNEQPVTKAEFNAGLQDLKQGLQAVEQRLQAQMDERFEAQDQRFQGRLDTAEQRITDRTVEAVRESETKLLQAFYFFAESNDRRHVQGEAATAVVVTRLATLESRVLNLERRLNLPPAV